MTHQPRKYNPLVTPRRKVDDAAPPPGREYHPSAEPRHAPSVKPRQYDPLVERRHNTPITPEIRAGYITTRVGDQAKQETEVKSTADQLYLHALNALDLTHKAQLTLLDRANVRQSMITHGIEAEEIYDEMTMLLIVSAFLDEDWKVQGVSRRAWTDSTLPSNASATWRSRFESDIALWLAPIQKLAEEGEPIQDEKGRAITAAFFIDNRNEKRSFAQEAASLVRSMDLDKPDDNLRFREIVAYAATHTKNEFRAYLHGDPPPAEDAEPEDTDTETAPKPRAKEKALATPREEEDSLPLADEVMYSKRVVYQDTGEVKDRIIVRFTLEVDTERKAQLVRERMSPFFRFPTTSRTVLEQELYAIPTT